MLYIVYIDLVENRYVESGLYDALIELMHRGDPKDRGSNRKEIELRTCEELCNREKRNRARDT